MTVLDTPQVYLSISAQGIYMYVYSMRLTHAEDDLDDLHGGIRHRGGGHGATGQALHRLGELRQRVKTDTTSANVAVLQHPVTAAPNLSTTQIAELF